MLGAKAVLDAAAAAQDKVETGPVVSARGVCIDFTLRGRASRAVNDVTLDVEAGEILAIVGESGSGKTTLAMAMLGLLPETARPQVSGCLEVVGLDVAKATNEQMRHLRRTKTGAIFQDPMSSLNPTMTLGDQLLEVCDTRDAAVQLLKSVGVPDPESRLGTYPHQISGGQRQRVMIAMAIARKPALLIADEPTTALDVTVQAQVLKLMADLCSETSSAMVFITHDLGVAAQLADRIAVMRKGHLVEIGPASNVLTTPQHPYTRRLLASRLTLTMDRRNPIPQISEDETTTEGALDLTKSDPFPITDFRLSPTAVRVQDIAVDYTTQRGLHRRRTVPALRGVSLEIAKGECVSLVGESGCGKSTLLRVVAGLRKANSGCIEIVGDEYPQMVFQDAGASLTPWLTVEELVGERLLQSGMRAAERTTKIRETLELVGLSPDLLGRTPTQLSGGQRQRLAFARAVVIPPPVLLADEPTSSLDISLAALVLNLIGTLRRTLDMAVLFVTHDMAAGRFVSDRTAVMKDGVIVEAGESDEVTHHPSDPYTQSLLSAIPTIGGFSELRHE